MSTSDRPVVATITGDRITIVLDNRFRSFLLDSEQGRKLAEAVKKKPQDVEEIRLIADIAAYIAAYSSGRVVLDDREQLRLDGKVVDYGIAPVFRRVMAEGFDVEPMCRFLENVAENPNEEIAQHLYPFLSKGKHPLTEDGCFLAFKRVSGEFMSFYGGTEEVRVWTPGVAEPEVFVGKVRYPLGARVEMDRDICDPSRESACSTGLHACSFDYLTQFHGGNGKIIIVKINPKNVTAFPYDSATKLRCCDLEVVGEIPEADAAAYFTYAVDRRHPSAQDEPQAPAEPHDWHKDGLEDGENTGARDREGGEPYDPSITWPEGLLDAGDDARQQYAAGYGVGYLKGWNEGVDPDYAEPEEEDAEPLDPEKTGYADGAVWAEGDTTFDPDFTSGEHYQEFVGDDEDRLNAYKQAFTRGYTETFNAAKG